jgi:hypothetical protein
MDNWRQERCFPHYVVCSCCLCNSEPRKWPIVRDGAAFNLLQFICVCSVVPFPYAVCRADPVCPSGTLSLFPVEVKRCQKSNHESQSLQVGCSHGNLNVDALSLLPGTNTNSSRYLPSAVVRSNRYMASCATLHHPRLRSKSGPRSMERKISIIT